MSPFGAGPKYPLGVCIICYLQYNRTSCHLLAHVPHAGEVASSQLVGCSSSVAFLNPLIAPPQRPTPSLTQLDMWPTQREHATSEDAEAAGDIPSARLAVFLNTAHQPSSQYHEPVTGPGPVSRSRPPATSQAKSPKRCIDDDDSPLSSDDEPLAKKQCKDGQPSQFPGTRVLGGRLSLLKAVTSQVRQMATFLLNSRENLPRLQLQMKVCYILSA
jgi:hypothetical protein